MVKQSLLVLVGIYFLAGNSITRTISSKKSCRLYAECPKCTKSFDSCSSEVTNIYAKAVKEAVSKLDAHTMSYEDYYKACREAKKTMDKADAACVEEYNKCCLAETKAEMKKNKKDKV